MNDSTQSLSSLQHHFLEGGAIIPGACEVLLFGVV